MHLKQEVKEGTLLLKEEPFAYILSCKNRTEYCDYCLKRGELLKCSACQYVYYCGRVCQREGWSIHKLECQGLKRVAPRILPDAARLLGRLIRKLQKGGDQIRSYYTEGHCRMFKDLMSHYSDLKNDQKRMEHFTSLYGVLYEYLGGELLPNSAELMGIYGRMCVNSFNICDQELKSLGTGVYLATSIIDHSCDPTAVAIFEGTTINIHTVKTISNFDWSKVFISYIDILNTPTVRREELQEMYYFLCQCHKCVLAESLDIMFSACCQNSKCGEAVPISNDRTYDAIYKCSKCSSKLSEDFIQKYREVMEFTELHLENMKQLAYVDVCKVCLKKQKSVLHHLNIYHVKTLDLAFDSCIEFGHFDEAKTFGIELMEGYLTYYQKFHPLVALLYLKLGKILVYQNEIEEARKYLKDAAEILKITHGLNATLFRNELIPLLNQVSN